MSDGTTCQCCYCAEWQTVPAPPAIVKCRKCGHDFRVLRNWSSGVKVELGEDAKHFFETRQKARAERKPVELESEKEGA